jgi:hypothetical protein
MFWQNTQGVFSLRWADFDNGIHHWVSELDIWVVFETVRKELEKYSSFFWESVVQKCRRLDGLDFEF